MDYQCYLLVSPFHVFRREITDVERRDYMTTAVRTGAEGSGAKGISLLIIDLHAKGVTMRKIENTGVNASGSTYVELEDVLFVPLLPYLE